MRIRSINLIRFTALTALLLVSGLNGLHAQTRTPEEQRELFNFCDKPALIRQYKLSEALADKVGDLQLWANQQQLSIAANTNEQFATNGELEQELAKKYKGLGLSVEQIKGVLDYKHEKEAGSAPCAAIELKYNRIFDTLAPQRAMILYKTPYRKPLLDKLGINGRQADQLFETEIWKQKEALSIAAIPESDFNRVRRTVAMYKEREHRYRAIGLSDAQIDDAILFFNEHQVGAK